MSADLENEPNEPRKRVRDPEATRQALLAACSTLLARQGPDAVSVSAVAKLAGFNRGTAYQHFSSREDLVAATVEWVSDTMFREVFGDPENTGLRKIEEVDVPVMTRRLTRFAMDNAEMGRSWLLQILASPDPKSDRFWKTYQGSIEHFTQTELAQPDMDSEAFSVLILSGTFLWPVWAQSQAHDDVEREHLALRMSREILRLSLFGSMKAEHFPEVVARLREPLDP